MAPSRVVACLVALLALAGGLTPRAARAQLRASERATVMQTVDGTRITVDYSRPRLRGRWPIYGTPIVEWDEAWTPGADDATTLTLTKSAVVAGRAVPAGSYSVWMVVRATGAWTLVLDPRATLYHTDHPDSTAEQHRMSVTPRTVPPVELLTWSFDSLANARTVLRMAWADRAVDIPIAITPTYDPVTPDSAAAPILGRYTHEWTDSTSAPRRGTVLITRRGQSVIATWEPAAYGGVLREAMLLRMPDGRWAQGFLRNGELWSVYAESAWQFVIENGRATGYAVAGPVGTVAVGRRRD